MAEPQLILVGARFGLTYHVARHIVILPLERAAVGECIVERVEITGWGDVMRQFMPGLVHVYSKGGALLLRASMMHVQAALNGGGSFWELMPNDVFTAETKQEYEEAEAREEAERWQEWD